MFAGQVLRPLSYRSLRIRLTNSTRLQLHQVYLSGTLPLSWGIHQVSTRRCRCRFILRNPAPVSGFSDTGTIFYDTIPYPGVIPETKLKLNP